MSAPRVRKTRTKTPPNQQATTPGPSNDANKDLPSRARKLDFPAKKPLEGKRFYMELTGPRHKLQLARLKADITELGGVVDEFLSKDVTCVISDRVDPKDPQNPLRDQKGLPHSGTSPAVSTPSPFHQSKEGTQGATDSPSNAIPDSSSIVTRGKAIVQKATKSQNYGSTDVLTNARRLRLPIKHLDVLVKFLTREKAKLKLNGNDKKKSSKEKSVKAKERQLTKPYLKAEDVSRRFRPISKEFSAWPRVLLDTRVGSCPYDPKTRNESVMQGAERTQDRLEPSQRTPDIRHKELSRSQSLGKKAISKAAKQREATAAKAKAITKKGFCEFCSVKYSSLEKHLQTEQHRQLVGEKNSYSHLDSMIAEGPNLVKFLEDCVRFRNVDPPTSSLSSSLQEDSEHSDNEDAVVLLTEPTTPLSIRRAKKAVKKGMTMSPSRKPNLARSLETAAAPEDTGVKDSRRRKGHRKSSERPQNGEDDGRRTGRVEEAGEVRIHGLAERLGGGDDILVNGESHAGLASPDISAGPSKQSSPTDRVRSRTKGKKRRSGGRKSLSPKVVDSRNVPKSSEAVRRDDVGGRDGHEPQHEGVILRGIAGEGELITQEGCGEEVMITRVRREDLAGDTCPPETTPPVLADTLPPSGDVLQNDAGLTERVNLETAGVIAASVAQESGIDGHDRPGKRGSEVVSSPEVQQLGRKSKKQRVSLEAMEDDDVFTGNPIHLEGAVGKSSCTRGSASGRNLFRHKRKSRRSHGEAPPRKVRGSSVAVDNSGAQQEAPQMGGSPRIRDPQPRVPSTPDNPSSDDFQPQKTPASASAKDSAKRRNGATDANNESENHEDSVGTKRRASSRSKVSSSQDVATEGNNSESDFQLAHPRSRKKRSSAKQVPLKSSSVNQKQQEDDRVVSGASPSNTENTTPMMNAEPGNEIIVPLSAANARNETVESDVNERVVPEPSEHHKDGESSQKVQEQQSLELVFRSDLGVEESSFLGFSQEEINETAERSRLLCQEDLEKAALSVYCLPSSDPVPDNNVNNDDDQSSTGSFGEFTIGLVLQKVDDFPSEGSEWEEQVSGFMRKLDTQLEIKKRRESELSTLPSPNFHKTVFGTVKDSLNLLCPPVEDFGVEQLSDDENVPVFGENGLSNNAEDLKGEARSSTRRRSTRINLPDMRPVTRSTPRSDISYSRMCSSPAKKRRNMGVSDSRKQIAIAEKQGTGGSPKHALRELSTNQLLNSPAENTDSLMVSTPKRVKRNLMNSPSRSPRVPHIVLPPGTPLEEQKEIVNNYVHDDSESEVVFPKFSSPVQKGSIFSPVKHRVKRKRFRQRHLSLPCLGHRDVQSSPIRPSHRSDLLPFGLKSSSSRKSLFMRGKVKRINISSPRKRSRSLSHSPNKTSHFLTFLNELKAGLSPTFFTFKKPHFSLHILQPSAMRRHCCRKRVPRSLLALNLSIPHEALLRIYEFHDDDSVLDEDEDDDELVISPIPGGTTRRAVLDQCTQTPPSSCKRRSAKPRRLSLSKRRTSQSRKTDLTPPIKAKANRTPVKAKARQCAEVDQAREGRRNVKLQASSPEIDSDILDMSLDFFL